MYASSFYSGFLTLRIKYIFRIACELEAGKDYGCIPENHALDDFTRLLNFDRNHDFLIFAKYETAH